MEYKEYIAKDNNKLVIAGTFEPIKRIICNKNVDLDIIECSNEDAEELELIGEDFYNNPLNKEINEDNIDDVLAFYANVPMTMAIEDNPNETEYNNKLNRAVALRDIDRKQQSTFFLLDKGYEINDNINVIIHE